MIGNDYLMDEAIEVAISQELTLEETYRFVACYIIEKMEWILDGYYEPKDDGL